MEKLTGVKIMVLSSLFPNSAELSAGLFVRERMFRVAQYMPLFVVSPKPWSPLDSLIRLIKPKYRNYPREQETQNNISVHFPTFFAIPLLGRRFDGFFMAKAVKKYLQKNNLTQTFSHIDAHFSYPDGYAGAKLKQTLNKTLTITMRGTEAPHSLHHKKRAAMLFAWKSADKVICVSNSLRNLAINLGANANKFLVVGNGVDDEKFHYSIDKDIRSELKITKDAKVFITVGGLVKRKGFDKVLSAMPKVMNKHSNMHYLIVGGETSEGNNKTELENLAGNLGVADNVHFLGKLAPEELKFYLSAADIFVLMSSNEGWANVILEAMACEIPVLASDVGGNAEVVSASEFGNIIGINDDDGLPTTMCEMLEKDWSREKLRAYAQDNCWQKRVNDLQRIFTQIQQRVTHD
ncbi:glycosyltransferase [Thalassotalea sp. ND16A]|uniref:glycosyltransferase n=1 Tax=Thalassotalea sp. ND16A TaxID=1535422 RepID=UPI00051A1027|nr:glycosyltransferase [Thalassotalea sp. ND16A]KGJ95956.1 hypothetical protein ND16A_1135 [Thalassotalea sp. ND16A]